MPETNTKKNVSRWGPRMILILMAMLTVSMAFFSGLYIQAGLPFFPSLIGGFAVFLTLFGTLPRQKPPSPATRDLHQRFLQFEKDILALSEQLEHFQGLSGKIGQLEQINPALQQLDVFLQEMKSQGQAMAPQQSDAQKADAQTKFAEFSQQLQELDNRIAHLNRELADKTASQPPPEKFAPDPGDVLPARGRKTVEKIQRQIEQSRHQPDQGPAGQNLSTDEEQILSIITRAIENRRVDIFLQPVVSLPKRKTIYYEVFTRLRDETNMLIMPDMFVPVAEQAGLMPLIDNMMLLRAIRIIRQMDRHTSARGLFCTLSTQSLVDPDFFPKLITFLEKNRDLSGRIIFEISQAQTKAAGPIERDGMRRLALLGFHFSLDKVTDLDIDFDHLAQMNFRFVRISADRLVNGLAELGARIHGADKADYLKRFGLDLIVERIETERELAMLADYSISLGQGYLFAEPRPIRPEILEENVA